MTCNWRWVLEACWSARDEYPAMTRRQRKTRGRHKQKAGREHRASGGKKQKVGRETEGMEGRRHGSAGVLWNRESADHDWVTGTHQEGEGAGNAGMRGKQSSQA